MTNNNYSVKMKPVDSDGKEWDVSLSRHDGKVNGKTEEVFMDVRLPQDKANQVVEGLQNFIAQL
ncbi:MAG: hypothetical protein OXI66_10790 [Boseongicola sp.]|nr:hypothetical protein [Boseongicola sp.]